MAMHGDMIDWRQLRHIADQDSLDVPYSLRAASSAVEQALERIEGMPPDQAALLIVALVTDVLASRGHRVPSAIQLDELIERNRMMRCLPAEFDGRNYQELARRYGVSTRSVRRIIDRRRLAARKGH